MSYLQVFKRKRAVVGHTFVKKKEAAPFGTASSLYQLCEC
jgi:hypothetical protein